MVLIIKGIGPIPDQGPKESLKNKQGHVYSTLMQLARDF